MMVAEWLMIVTDGYSCKLWVVMGDIYLVIHFVNGQQVANHLWTMVHSEVDSDCQIVISAVDIIDAYSLIND